MKYLACDLETVGICKGCKGPDKILMASFVVEDTECATPIIQLPHLTRIIDQPIIVGEPTALTMNAWLLVAIERSKSKQTDIQFRKKYIELGIASETVDKGLDAFNKYPVISVESFTNQALVFMSHHFGDKDNITVAGKNVTGFDIPFLPTVISNRFRGNAIDWGMLFWKPLTDRQVPSSAEVMKRAGIDFTGAHDALQDNLMGIAAARTAYKRLTNI